METCRIDIIMSIWIYEDACERPSEPRPELP
jgi:hypothetical protein